MPGGNLQEFGISYNGKPMSEFYKDVKAGLLAPLKSLPSKYFYDKTGDRIFQKLMYSDEYYLSRCELSILRNQSGELSKIVADRFGELDLVELGAGDASKSAYLIRALQETEVDFNYYPIDISPNVISHLHKKFRETMPALKIHGLNGDYLKMLKKQRSTSRKPLLILFLGSNVGNMNQPQAVKFCRQVNEFMQEGDLFLVGVDLKKNPHTILRAYNDQEGLTKDFNLNLLTRINIELGANFNIDKYMHFPLYDPVSGECRSYLISTSEQTVSIGKKSEQFEVRFKAYEPIHMEVSKKYDLHELNALAKDSGFKSTKHFFDDKKYFVDSLWQK